MIKRILSIILALVIFSCLYGCDQDNRVEDEPTETITDTDETELNLIEQTESDYIISTDWMTFYFSKGDFKESDVQDVAEEAVSVMTRIALVAFGRYGLLGIVHIPVRYISVGRFRIYGNNVAYCKV